MKNISEKLKNQKKFKDDRCTVKTGEHVSTSLAILVCYSNDL